MTTKTAQENLEIDQGPDDRIAALAKELSRGSLPSINLESLYSGDSLRATGSYDGLLGIMEAFRRLRGYVRKFQDLSEGEAKKITPEIVQHAKDALQVLREAGGGEDLSELDKKAAQLLAKDILSRARVLRDAEMLSADARGTINAIYTEIRQLIDMGTIAGKKPKDSEDRFPLAFVMQKVKEIEQVIERSTQAHLRTREQHARLTEAHSTPVRLEQVRLKRKK